MISNHQAHRSPAAIMLLTMMTKDDDDDDYDINNFSIFL